MEPRVLGVLFQSFKDQVLARTLQLLPRAFYTICASVTLFFVLRHVALGMQAHKPITLLLWEVTSGLSVAAWLAVPLFAMYLRPKWRDWRYAQLVPGQRRGRDLVKLARLLGELQETLNQSKNETVVEIRRELTRAEWRVWTEASWYLALYSTREEEQCLALRNLSQVEGEGAMKRTAAILAGVLDSPFASPQVRAVAMAAMDELRRRQSLRVKTDVRGRPQTDTKC